MKFLGQLIAVLSLLSINALAETKNHDILLNGSGGSRGIGLELGFGGESEKEAAIQAGLILKGIFDRDIEISAELNIPLLTTDEKEKLMNLGWEPGVCTKKGCTFTEKLTGKKIKVGDTDKHAKKNKTEEQQPKKELASTERVFVLKGNNPDEVRANLKKMLKDLDDNGVRKVMLNVTALPDANGHSRCPACNYFVPALKKFTELDKKNAVIKIDSDNAMLAGVVAKELGLSYPLPIPNTYLMYATVDEKQPWYIVREGGNPKIYPHTMSADQIQADINQRFPSK